MRSRFARRVGFGFAVFFLLLFATSSLAVALVSGVFGVHRHHGLVPLAAVLGLVLLAGFVMLWRSVRQLAEPVGEVLQAADRVAAGDYSIRVDARGVPEMRRLARAFNTMTERLGTNERRRRQFLAEIAHELRTPLSVIQGNLEGMLDGLYPPDREHLETVLEEAKVLARLLEDLRTLSTAEAGALALHLEPLRPEDLVSDVVGAFGATAESAGVALRDRVAPGLPALSVDRVRIGEVLGNLVSNAVRATPRGGSVTISVAPARDGRAVEFAVADDGPGIPPELRSRVFDRFVKSPGSGGSGLGLAIAKTLVEAHGGEISASSAEGAGTTVRVVLPAEAADRAGHAKRLGTMSRPPE